MYETASANDNIDLSIKQDVAQDSNVSAFDALMANDRSARAEMDRRITKALDTHRAKWEHDAAARIEEAQAQAQKLASLSVEERAQHESKRLEDEINNRMKSLDARESELTRRELRAEATRILAERNVPIWLADALDYTDGEKCNKSLERFAQEYERDRAEVLEAQRVELTRGQPPKSNAVRHANASDELAAKLRRQFIHKNKKER